ncbi:MAG: hypothetical protein AAGI68_01955 [Planctomycetota bacterium]
MFGVLSDRAAGWREEFGAGRGVSGGIEEVKRGRVLRPSPE